MSRKIQVNTYPIFHILRQFNVYKVNKYLSEIRNCLKVKQRNTTYVRPQFIIDRKYLSEICKSISEVFAYGTSPYLYFLCILS